MRAIAPVLIALTVALGACGSNPTNDLESSLKSFASDVQRWANAHTQWAQALGSASPKDVERLAGEQVAAMRKAADSIAKDVQSLDDADLQKTLKPMISSVDDVQRAAQKVVDALHSEGKDAYAKALVAYQKVADEAARRQQQISKIIEQKLGKDG